METPAAPLGALTEQHLTDLVEKAAISPEILKAAGFYSYQSRSDLPQGLQHAPDGPGYVIAHYSVDGSITFQARPDTPVVDPETGKAKKYLFAKGASNGPFCHPAMKPLAGHAEVVIAVEGSKQAHAVASWAPEGVLVVGIPGCYGGIHDGLYSNDWTKLVKPGASVYLMFDKDVDGPRGNPKVYDAAKTLGDHLEVVCGARVRFIHLPTMGKDDDKNGADDFLASIKDESLRTSALRNLMTKAKGLGRRPAERTRQNTKAAELLKVDMATGRILAPTPNTGRPGASSDGTVILSAAAQIETVYYICNDLDPDRPSRVEYDLKVAVEVNGVVHTQTLRAVTDKDLKQARNWLSRITGGLGAVVPSPPGRNGEEDVERAIRAGSDPRTVTIYERSGWKEADGEVGFMDTKNHIRAHDTSPLTRARIKEPTMKTVAFPDPHLLTENEKAAAVRSILEMNDIFNDATGYELALGAASSAVLGLPPLGVTGTMGARGTGKSTSMNAVASIYGPKFECASFQGTENAIGDLGAGVHHLMLPVDDLQDLRTRGYNAVAENNAKFELLTRRSYQKGADTGRTRKHYNDSSGEWENKASDPSKPSFVVTAERKAIPVGAESSIDRTLLANVTPGSMFGPGDDARLSDIAGSGLPNRAWGAYIAWLAGIIESDYSGNLQRFFTEMDLGRTGFKSMLARENEDIEHMRRHEVASSPLWGLKMFLVFALETGVIDDAEYYHRLDGAISRLTHAMRFWDTQVAGRAAESAAFSKLISAVQSGKYVIDFAAGAWSLLEPGTTRLGWVGNIQGQQVVYLVEDVAARICRTDAKTLALDLDTHLLKDARTGGKKVSAHDRTKNKRGRLMAIPVADWGLFEDNPGQLESSREIDGAA